MFCQIQIVFDKRKENITDVKQIRLMCVVLSDIKLYVNSRKLGVSYGIAFSRRTIHVRSHVTNAFHLTSTAGITLQPVGRSRKSWAEWTAKSNLYGIGRCYYPIAFTKKKKIRQGMPVWLSFFRFYSHSFQSFG